LREGWPSTHRPWMFSPTVCAGQCGCNSEQRIETMILGKVVGTVVTTISHRDYKNRRLLVIQPLGLEREPLDEPSSPWTTPKPVSVTPCL